MPDLFIGLMSGTSMDGVDGVLVDFGGTTPHVLSAHFLPYPQALRLAFLDLNCPGNNELHRAAVATHELVALYADVCHTLMRCAGRPGAAIRAIGAHGQTVRHQPPAADTAHPYTWQLNQPARLAELTGLPVVADFRSRDLAAGGQGAPLVPPFHAALFAQPGVSRAVVNIGGMANITTLPAQGALRGLDTGPGNVLLDGWCQQHTGQTFDADGTWGLSGTPDPGLLARLLADAYFHQTGVKSTGRDRFHMAWLQHHLQGLGHLAAPDIQATLAQLTAQTISLALLAQPWGAVPLSEVVVCGGGSKNQQIMQLLAQALPGIAVTASDSLGWPSQWVEPAAFAWLARQHVLGLQGNLPEVTGAQGPRILGAYYPA
jgi:anhydro-N-acetylmuramic acid kinase